MSDSIFLLRDGCSLTRLNETPYDSENLLQALIAEYPDLLAGDQISNGAPHSWLLISREMPVPGEEHGVGRWSLDHLFVDHNGIPTLVEVKRSSDTRIRREVVGQMLDYAANAVAYWPVERVRAEFERACEDRSASAEQTIQDFLGYDADPEEFWQKVKTNLQAGRIRMLFVADIIPTELRRIIEFLNQQMDPAEVLAIEVRQFVGEAVKTLVPRLFGQTAQAETRKGTSNRSKREWNEDRFLADATERKGLLEADDARKVIAWAIARGVSIRWGSGESYGCCTLGIIHRGERYVLADLGSDGTVAIRFERLRKQGAFYRCGKAPRTAASTKCDKRREAAGWRYRKMASFPGRLLARSWTIRPVRKRHVDRAEIDVLWPINSSNLSAACRKPGQRGGAFLAGSDPEQPIRRHRR